MAVAGQLYEKPYGRRLIRGSPSYKMCVYFWLYNDTTSRCIGYVAAKLLANEMLM
jgi:hypothetical protein